MTDFGQFQEPFAQVPLEPESEEPNAEGESRAEVWWIDDEEETDR